MDKVNQGIMLANRPSERQCWREKREENRSPQGSSGGWRWGEGWLEMKPEWVPPEPARA